MKIVSIISVMCILCFLRCTPKKLTYNKQRQSTTSQNQDSTISDTLGSVKTIVGNKSKYIDRELTILLNDLPDLVKSYGIINHNLNEIAGITLSFNDSETTRYLQGNDNVVLKPIKLFIIFKSPVPVKKHNELWGNSSVRGKWNTDDEAYYSKQIVADVRYSAEGRE